MDKKYFFYSLPVPCACWCNDDAVNVITCPRCEPVFLERAEESSPCVITLLCRPDSGAVITSLQIVSEARTVEVYSLSGDYCGTSRGEEDPRWQRSRYGVTHVNKHEI